MEVSYYEKIGDEVRCIDEEIPFEIPEGWAWCRLQSCCCKEIKRGKAPRYATAGSVRVFAQKCNTKYDGIHMELALCLDNETLKKYDTDDYMKDGDIVINSTGTGTLGRVGLYRIEDTSAKFPVVPDTHVTVVRVWNGLEPGYFYAVLKSYQPTIEELGDGSTNQKELRPATIAEQLVPVPPVNAQRTILQEINRLQILLQTIEQSLS